MPIGSSYNRGQVYPAGNADAFGRTRTSEVTTIFDVKHPTDKLPELVDEETIGTGASAHQPLDASVLMTTAADGDAVIRQTFQRAPYFAGKSQQFFFTFDNIAPEPNIIKRVGCFQTGFVTPFDSDRDGCFIESSNGTLYCVVSKNGNETVRAPRSEWIDQLDGHGKSGITADFTKAQILSIDYEYLGVGLVRFFIVIGGEFVLIYQYNHANAGNSTYMRYSNQPIRYEIRQVGDGSGSLEMVCSTVGTEGSLNQIGRDGSVNTGIDPVDADNSANTYACIGLRMTTDYPNIHAHIVGATLLSSTNDNLLWELRRNPTVAGTFTYSSVNSIEAAISNDNTNTVTGGELLQSGYVPSNGVIDLQRETAERMGLSINGTPDEFVLCVRATGPNADVLASVDWIEEN